MALKFVILALAISAAAAARVPAAKERALTRANRQELRYRLEGCAANFPGRWAGSFESSPQEQCVTDAIDAASSERRPQETIINVLPKCMKKAGSAESDIAKLSDCLQKNIPLPWTFVEGNTVYTKVQAYTHMFAIQDCLESSEDVKKVDPLINQTCAYQLYLQYGYGASEHAARKWLEACFDRAGLAKQKAADAVKCFTNELKDPAVIKRAQDYYNGQGF